MPRIITHLQKDVISYILAVNEEREPPENNAAHIMRAFEGGFFPTMPFTLFMPVTTKVILYMAEEKANESADRRSEFNKRCEMLKKPLVDMAHFIIELVDHDYLRVIVKEKKAELPLKYGAYWRRYDAFYASEIDALRFACSNWLVPKLKLYRMEKPQPTGTGEEKNARLISSSEHRKIIRST
jgi:hypothetical protein